MLTIRPARWPQDIAAVSSLDASFTTDSIYEPVLGELSFGLVERAIDPPIRKQYRIEALDDAGHATWDYAAVAEKDGQLAGFTAAEYTAWNRRVILHHLYVATQSRGLGIGRRLLDEVDAFARSANARCLWLETQNVNFSAIRFYRHVGFQFCGFDRALYDPDILEQEEIALFFDRPIQTPSQEGLG